MSPGGAPEHHVVNRKPFYSATWTHALPSLRTVILGLLASDEHGELVPGADDGGQGEGRVGHTAHRVKLQLLGLSELVDEARQLPKTNTAKGWCWAVLLLPLNFTAYFLSLFALRRWGSGNKRALKVMAVQPEEFSIKTKHSWGSTGVWAYKLPLQV